MTIERFFACDEMFTKQVCGEEKDLVYCRLKTTEDEDPFCFIEEGGSCPLGKQDELKPMIEKGGEVV